MVTGDDVIAALVRRGEAPAGFKGDERVGAALRWLFEQVTDEPERNERSLLLRNSRAVSRRRRLAIPQ